MIMNIRWSLVLVLLAGCVQPTVMINGGAIHNGSGRELRNIRVVHNETRKVVIGNSLLPDRDFVLEFNASELKARTATLSWDDPLLGSRKVVVELPHGENTNGPQRLIYYISPTFPVRGKNH